MPRSIRRLPPVELVGETDDTITIPLYDDSNALLSVTGKTARWVLYRGVPKRGRKPFRGTVVLEKTSAAGEIALTDGQAVVTIANSDLAARQSGEYWQSIEVTTTSGSTIESSGSGPVSLRYPI